MALVPIPDSRSGLEDAVAPRTLGMATALAARLGSQAIVADILRWSQAMPSAHQAGGTRDPASLYQKARLSGIVPRDRRLMLIDDVLASGGHLRATAAFLTDHGALVAGAICAGRADDGVLGDDAFAVRVEVLPDFKYSCE
jgi:adenine/guanine phosphoribosyltransferase-like PRPP-binding protein